MNRIDAVGKTSRKAAKERSPRRNQWERYMGEIKEK